TSRGRGASDTGSGVICNADHWFAYTIGTEVPHVSPNWSCACLCGALALAVGQQTSPTKLEDSSPPAKVDSPSSRPHVRFGGVFIGAGYSRYFGYPSYGYSSGFWGRRPDFLDPFLFWPFAPGFTTGFVYRPNMGEVKIQTSNKTAWVYLDGAFA